MDQTHVWLIVLALVALRYGGVANPDKNRNLTETET